MQRPKTGVKTKKSLDTKSKNTASASHTMGDLVIRGSSSIVQKYQIPSNFKAIGGRPNTAYAAKYSTMKPNLARPTTAGGGIDFGNNQYNTNS